MTTRESSPGKVQVEHATQEPDWYGPDVEAVLAVFEATGDKPDPCWRSLARDCVAAVWKVNGIWEGRA